MDLGRFSPKAMREASVLSAVAIIVPFGFGALAAVWFNDAINSNGIPTLQLSIFLGTALAITAFPMLARQTPVQSRTLELHRAQNSPALLWRPEQGRASLGFFMADFEQW